MKNIIFHRYFILNTNRILYLDYLKILSAFAVIVLHTAVQNWYSFSLINTFNWHILDIYNILVRWCVPIFVMVSGAIFINKNITVNKIYTKYIKRLVYAFIFWSLFYSILSTGGDIATIIRGHYHLWFIPMIIGLYMSLPIVKEIVKNEKVTKYFLFLSFIFTFTIPFIQAILNNFAIHYPPENIAAFNKTIEYISPSIVLGYISYFIVGYYIHTHEIKKNTRVLIYISAILSLIITIILHKSAIFFNGINPQFIEYLTLPVFLQSIAIFTFFKYVNFKNNSMLLKLSKYTFGIYLIHVFVLDTLKNIGLNTLSFNAIFSVPVISIITFVVSALLIIVICKTPLKKVAE